MPLSLLLLLLLSLSSPLSRLKVNQGLCSLRSASLLSGAATASYFGPVHDPSKLPFVIFLLFQIVEEETWSCLAVDSEVFLLWYLF